MSRRIDIELTSRRDDGTWTWRAPGARQPRGSLDGALVPSVAKVGDVLRAEAEFDVEGIVVTSVQPPRTDARLDHAPARIEILGSGRTPVEGVSVTLAHGGRSRRDDLEHERRPRRPAGERAAGRPGVSRAPGGRGDEGRARPADRTRPGAERAPRPERAPRAEGAARPERAPRPERPERVERGPRPARAGGIAGAARTERAAAPGHGARPERPSREGAARRERPRRGEPLTVHRNAALAALSPEQIPVAEQLLRGGIPAVRQAIDEQNARARADGRAEVSAEPLLAMAEQLLPRMNLAAWKDRAVAIRSAGKDAPLREVRSVVAGASTVALDDEARVLVVALREALDNRITALRQAWLQRITTALDEDRVADALRVSARPPEPTARVPADTAVRLAEAAGSVMTPELSEPEWIDMLDAVVTSPVRRTVKPAGLPANPGPELVTAARHAAGLVPELAKLLGLPIPPPPGPRRSAAMARRG